MAVRTLLAARGISCHAAGRRLLSYSSQLNLCRMAGIYAGTLLASALLLCGAPISASAAGTAGVFADRAGGSHAWSVTTAHVLLWDGQPYIPVGGVFAPRYLAEGQTEDNWKKDADALALIKSKGVTDLIITPTISAVDVPAVAWQRVLDSLDADGFRYGLEFGAGITAPLTGVIVKPTRYRIENVRESDGATWHVTDADSARYFFVDPMDGTRVLGEGQARVQDDEISVQPSQSTGDGSVALLFPHKTLKLTAGLPDVWAGFDAYRDRLLTVMSQVKFGPGLRFFLDPLCHPLSLAGEEAENIVPDSPAFKLEWEAWLKEKWPSIEDILTRWGLQDREIKEYGQAARMIPLSAGGRGIGFMLDTKTGTRFEIRGGNENFWADLREFRNQSLTFYMNAMSDILKRELANVPVVYTRSEQHSIYTNRNAASGFDGLGIAAYGRGSSLATSGADSAISQADAAVRPMWCVVTETLDTDSPSKGQLGYTSQDAMFYDLDWLRSVGARGFYINGFQVLPDSLYHNFQLVRAPEQVGWVKTYCDRVARGSTATVTRGATLLYPPQAEGYVHSGPIGNTNVWWAPSLNPGKPLRFGDSYAGYTIQLAGGERTVLWALHGPRLTHLIVGDPRSVTVAGPDGTPVTVKPDLKHKSVILTLDQTPIVLRGNDSEVFPAEAAEDALLVLRSLVAEAEAAKVPSAAEYRLQMEHALNNYRMQDSRVAYALAADTITSVVQVVQPYTWAEAEGAQSQSFSEVVNNSAASGGAYLSLNADNRPGSSGYGAEYSFQVPADDLYTVWIACSPPGPQTSPFAWIIDEDQKHTESEANVVGSTYLGNRFVWLNLGHVSLKKGSHSFVLRITDPVAGSNRYLFDFDAFLVTRKPFTPNGTEQPSLSAGLSKAELVKAGKGKRKKTNGLDSDLIPDSP